MARRLDSTNNIDFLYKCIESSGVKVDFNKAGRALGVKPNAARMRYQRLQKSLGSGPAIGTMPTVISTPKKAGTKRKKSVLAKASATSKKRKIEEGDADSVVASDSDVDPTDGTNELIKDDKNRSTRGIKTDYSKMLARPEPLSVNISSEEVSDRASDSEASLYEDSRSNPATTSLVIQSIEQTPPPTVDSIKQVFTASQMTEDDEGTVESSTHVTPTPAQTPTRVARKTKSNERSFFPHEEPADDLRDELDALKCGQKVSESMFKKRKHIHISSTLDSLPAPRPRPSPNLRRLRHERRPGKDDGADEEILELAMIGDSVCPDDSISMAGEVIVKHDVERAMVGRSFLQRVSQLWKQK